MTDSSKKSVSEESILTLYNEVEAASQRDKNSDFIPIRQAAFKQYLRLGLPTHKSEEYKYTPILRMIPSPLRSTEKINADIDKEYLIKNVPWKDDSFKIVFINGILSSELSDLGKLSGPFKIRTIDEIINNDLASLKELFNKDNELSLDPFLSLNSALSKNGLFIDIHDKAILNTPIYIIHYTDDNSQSLFINTRHIVRAGQGSRSQIAEFFISKDGQSYFENLSTSFIIGADAVCGYHKIQLLGNQAIHIGTTRVYQNRSSTFNSFTASLKGGMIRNNLNIRMEESYCEAHLFGLIYLGGKDHVDNHTVVDHRMPNCYSNEYYKGILDDESKGVFNGKIYVQPKAQKTNAYQSNKNVLLSENASIDTKPQLEIWADDVKCSHGTTTGKLDDEQLFYLQSRGLNKTSARSLLVYAFANDLIEKMDIEGIKLFIGNKIRERLGSSI